MINQFCECKLAYLIENPLPHSSPDLAYHIQISMKNETVNCIKV